MKKSQEENLSANEVEKRGKFVMLIATLSYDKNFVICQNKELIEGDFRERKVIEKDINELRMKVS